MCALVCTSTACAALRPLAGSEPSALPAAPAALDPGSFPGDQRGLGVGWERVHTGRVLGDGLCLWCGGCDVSLVSSRASPRREAAGVLFKLVRRPAPGPAPPLCERCREHVCASFCLNTCVWFLAVAPGGGLAGSRDRGSPRPEDSPSSAFTWAPPGVLVWGRISSPSCPLPEPRALALDAVLATVPPCVQGLHRAGCPGSPSSQRAPLHPSNGPH